MKTNNVSKALCGGGIFIAIVAFAFAFHRWGGWFRYDDPSQMWIFTVVGCFIGLVSFSWGFIHHRNIVTGTLNDERFDKIEEQQRKDSKRQDDFYDYLEKRVNKEVMEVMRGMVDRYIEKKLRGELK